jgi:Excreted virulence factor EspC, type VII ESX diderm
VILHVDPAALSATAVPLREAAEVAREVHSNHAVMAAHLEHAGSESVHEAAASFLEAWAGGLGALSTRGEALARLLDIAAVSYGDTEQHAHGQIKAGVDEAP